MSNRGQILALGSFLILLLSVALFVYVKTMESNPPHEPKIRGLSNIKQLATSTAIYQADYDDLFPATSAMPGTRAVLMPYVKLKKLFEEYPDSSTMPLFNFNVAGVHSSCPPYPGTNQIELGVVGVFYARSLEKPGYFFIGRADTSAKSTKTIDLQLALSYQFDRKGVKLQPSDYLENEDPLK